MVNRGEPGIELTAGAREALDHVLDQIRIDLLRRAAAIATDPSEDRIEITGRDVRSAANDLLPTPRSIPFRRPALQRVFLVYASLGLLIVVVAGVGLLVQTFERNVNPITSIAATSAVAGAVLAAVSAAAAYFLSRIVSNRLDRVRPEPRLVAIDEFVTTWARIEDLVRNLAAPTLGEFAQDAPFSDLNRALSARGITAADLRELDALRDFRNRLVHGRLENIGARQLARARVGAEELLASLSRAMDHASWSP